MSDEMKLPASLDKNDVKVLQQAIKQSSKIEEIENETALYVKDVFNIVRNRASFLDRIESELESRIGEMSISQLAALVSNETINVNDAINKALAPTSTILTEKQRTEQAQQQARVASVQLSQSNIGQINAQAPVDVLQGLQALFSLQESAKTAVRPIESQEIISGQTSERP